MKKEEEEEDQIENRLCWVFGSMHLKYKSNIVYTNNIIINALL